MTNLAMVTLPLGILTIVAGVLMVRYGKSETKMLRDFKRRFNVSGAETTTSHFEYGGGFLTRFGLGVMFGSVVSYLMWYV